MVIICAACILMGCALTKPLPPIAGDTASQICLAFYHDLDKVVAEQGVTPSRPERIADFPYLRMTRFMASFSEQDLDSDALKQWLLHLAAADQQARLIELASLTPSGLAKLNADHGFELMALIEDCAQKLVKNDLAHPQRLALLRKQANPASEYRLLNQVLGLYPLTSIPVNLGVHLYHEKTLAVFAQPLEKLPVYGQLRRFHIPKPEPVNPSEKVTHDALGIPVHSVMQLHALFAHHAPVWEIDVVDSYDLPGRPVWQADGKPGVDHSDAVIYYYPTYTHWRGQSLLQLNYLIWFSERPPENAVDIFSGRLDGLLWRVTLNKDGSVLIYDSVHACGCYHYFFPSSALVLRSEAQHLPEPPLLLQQAPALSIGQNLVIRVASGNHHIQRLYGDEQSGRPLLWQEYETLYMTPVVGGGHRSLFRSDGLVDGSERLERWLLWPMGVPSAGAMRERGRHATAFIGRRHFDDATLLDKLFEPASPYRH